MESQCQEEQQMELEALESLFPEEMKRISETEFVVENIFPFSDNSQKNFVSCDIKFVYPPRYPVEASIKFEVTKMTGAIANDSVLSAELVDVIRTEAEVEIGYAVVYQIVEKVIDFLRENNQQEKSLHDQLASSVPKVQMANGSDDEDDSDWSGSSDYDDDDDDSDYEEEEDEDYKGLQLKNLCSESDRVTVEQFAQWKMTYDEWLMENKYIKRVSESDVKPTGKQQFVSVLVSRQTEDTVDDTMGEFDEELFEDDDDFGDLDDDEDEDGNENS